MPQGGRAVISQSAPISPEANTLSFASRRRALEPQGLSGASA